MECKLCNKIADESELLRGIFEGKIEPICAKCARIEKIPLIQKPSFEEERKENLSVKERIEKISNPGKFIQKEGFVVHKGLTKLNFPVKREDHPDLVENYDWILKAARRRKKLSQRQLAEELIIPFSVIVSLESGRIVKDFINYAEKLEAYFGIEIIKKTDGKFILQKKPQNLEEERIVIDSVKKNIEKEEEGEEIEEAKPVSLDNERLKKWTLRGFLGLNKKRKKSE